MKYFPEFDHDYKIKTGFDVDHKYIDAPQGMMFPHYHEDYEIYFLVSGNRKYFVDNRIYTLQPNQVVIFHPGVSHQVTVNLNIPYERYLLYVTPTLFSNIIKENSALKIEKNSQLFNLSESDFKGAVSYFPKLYEEHRRNDAYSPNFIKNTLAELLLFVQRHNDTSSMEVNSVDFRIQSAVDYILNNYNEPLTLAEVADIACMSPTYFSRVFHHTTALTFKEFLTKLRIDKACELLETTNNHVADVAQSVGFNTESYFAAAFRAINSVSPNQYRKAHKEIKNAGKGRK